MVHVSVFVLVALAAIVYAVPTPDNDHYTTKYDTVDIDELIKNDRLLNQYLACFQGTGKCTKDAEEIKKNFKEALKTCCVKCSDYQKNMLKKVYHHVKDNKPEKLTELQAIYDPNNEYEGKCVKDA